MEQTFLQFCNELKVYSFQSKKTGHQVFKFELYWNKISPKQCFSKFDAKVIIKELNLN